VSGAVCAGNALDDIVRSIAKITTEVARAGSNGHTSLSLEIRIPSTAPQTSIGAVPLSRNARDEIGRLKTARPAAEPPRTRHPHLLC
jgi:hypothetical protein